MNILERKNFVACLFVATGTIFSFVANAQQVSLEQLLTHKVQVQGQQVLKMVSSQVKQSVQNSLNVFSADIKQQWFTEENAKTAPTSNKKVARNLSSKSSAE